MGTELIPALGEITPPLAELSQERVAVELALILVLAVTAQLLAPLLRLPSILLLLLFGFVAGASGLLQPDDLLGPLLNPIVAIAVGVILFDGGLELKFSQLGSGYRHSVIGLLTFGVAITAVLAAIFAHLLFDLTWELSILLGAVLVVSGPTVVGPLLDYIRPAKRVGTILRWEGTLVDPIGAILAVLIFQALLATRITALGEVVAFLSSIGIGVGIGLLGALALGVLVLVLRLSESQAQAATLAVVVAGVTAANVLREDAGLITAIVMGGTIANLSHLPFQDRFTPIRSFADSRRVTRSWRERVAALSTLLIGTLFIILSARVTPAEIADLGPITLAFTALLILVVRPVAAFISTIRTSLALRERAFVAWMAPRGIIAAATSAAFALGLKNTDIPDTGELVPITFTVIVGTAFVYGLTSGHAARLLGLAAKGPQGVLFVGANAVARALAKALQDEGIRTVLWAESARDTELTKSADLLRYKGNPLVDLGRPEPSELDDIGHVLLMSGSAEFNSLVGTDMVEAFDHHLFQLPVGSGAAINLYERGRVMFDKSASYPNLDHQLRHGATIEAITIAEHEPPPNPREEDSIPLFVVTPGKSLQIVPALGRVKLRPGQVFLRLVPPQDDDAATR